MQLSVIRKDTELT